MEDRCLELISNIYFEDHNQEKNFEKIFYANGYFTKSCNFDELNRVSHILSNYYKEYMADLEELEDDDDDEKIRKIICDKIIISLKEINFVFNDQIISESNNSTKNVQMQLDESNIQKLGNDLKDIKITDDYPDPVKQETNNDEKTSDFIFSKMLNVNNEYPQLPKKYEEKYPIPERSISPPLSDIYDKSNNLDIKEEHIPIYKEFFSRIDNKVSKQSTISEDNNNDGHDDDDDDGHYVNYIEAPVNYPNISDNQRDYNYKTCNHTFEKIPNYLQYCTICKYVRECPHEFTYHYENCIICKYCSKKVISSSAWMAKKSHSEKNTLKSFASSDYYPAVKPIYYEIDSSYNGITINKSDNCTNHRFICSKPGDANIVCIDCEKSQPCFSLSAMDVSS